MRKSIKKVIAGTPCKHQVCAWHVMIRVVGRATEHNKQKMKNAFQRFLLARSVKQVTHGINQMKKLSGNTPLNNAYFNGGFRKLIPLMVRAFFFGNMQMDCTTSSPVESANSQIKRWIKRTLGVHTLVYVLHDIFMEQRSKVCYPLLFVFFYFSLFDASDF